MNYSKAIFLEQQQFIRKERQRISEEIHDDIGSGLFAIQLFADIARRKKADVPEIKELSIMINEMSEKIHEIIWSTNTESDHLENLLYYIEHQVIKLFEHTNINFSPNFPINTPDLVIDSISRRNIYLLVKEIVYNAVKHSKASHVSLNVNINKGILMFTVKDNGVGFDPVETRQEAMGLKSISSRIETLQGELILENYKGTTVVVKIPLSNLVVSAFEE